MESPQTFSAPPPKKGSNTVLVVVLVVLGLCCVCCIGGGLFFFQFMKKAGQAIGCVTHYEFARQALSQYMDEHQGKLPPAAHWQDDIIPYYAKDRGSSQRANGGGILDFGDPTKDIGCPGGDSGPATGMAFNSELGGKTRAEVLQKPYTVLLFEVPETGRNIAKPYKLIPGESPQKLMGQPRAWITYPVSGQGNFGNSMGTSRNGQTYRSGL